MVKLSKGTLQERVENLDEVYKFLRDRNYFELNDIEDLIKVC